MPVIDRLLNIVHPKDVYSPTQATDLFEQLKQRVRNTTKDPVSGIKAFAQFEPFMPITNPSLFKALMGNDVDRKLETSWAPKIEAAPGAARNGTLGMIAHLLAMGGL